MVYHIYGEIVDKIHKQCCLKNSEMGRLIRMKSFHEMEYKLSRFCKQITYMKSLRHKNCTITLATGQEIQKSK